MSLLESMSKLIGWPRRGSEAEEEQSAPEFAQQARKAATLIRHRHFPGAQELLDGLREACLEQQSEEIAALENTPEFAKLEKGLQNLTSDVRKTIGEFSQRRREVSEELGECGDQVEGITTAALDRAKESYRQLATEETRARLAELDQLQARLNRARNEKLKEVFAGVVEKADISSEEAKERRAKLIPDATEMHQFVKRTGQQLEQSEQEMRDLVAQYEKEKDPGKLDLIERRMKEVGRCQRLFDNAHSALEAKGLDVFREFVQYREGIHELQDAINHMADIQGIQETDLRSDFATFYHLLVHHRRHLEIVGEVLGAAGETSAWKERSKREELEVELFVLKDRLNTARQSTEDLETNLAKERKEHDSYRAKTQKVLQKAEKGIAERNKWIEEARKRIAQLEAEKSALRKTIDKLEQKTRALETANEEISHTEQEQERERILKDVLDVWKEHQEQVKTNDEFFRRHLGYGFIILEAWRGVRESRNTEETDGQFKEEVARMLREEDFRERYLDEKGKQAVADYNSYRGGRLSYKEAKAKERFEVGWLRPFQIKLLGTARDGEHPCQDLVVAILSEREELPDSIEQDAWCELWEYYAEVLDGRKEKQALQARLKRMLVHYQEGRHPNQEQIDDAAHAWGWARCNMEEVSWFRLWVKNPGLMEHDFRLDKMATWEVK